MVDDLDQGLFEQPRIDGVKDKPLAGHSVKQLEMMVGVPRQRSKAVALRQSKGLQRGRQPQAAFRYGGIAIAMDAAIDVT